MIKFLTRFLLSLVFILAGSQSFSGSSAIYSSGATTEACTSFRFYSLQLSSSENSHKTEFKSAFSGHGNSGQKVLFEEVEEKEEDFHPKDYNYSGGTPFTDFYSGLISRNALRTGLTGLPQLKSLQSLTQRLFVVFRVFRI